MQIIENKMWANAIAERIVDESDLKNNFPEDCEFMRKAIFFFLNNNEEICREFIGTGIIEEGYFDNLD